GPRMRGPEAGGVAAHEIPLEAARRGPGHRAVAERPAAGIEPVHGPSRAEQLGELAVARLEPCPHVRSERDRRAGGDHGERLDGQRRGRGERDHPLVRLPRQHAPTLAERSRSRKFSRAPRAFERSTRTWYGSPTPRS